VTFWNLKTKNLFVFTISPCREFVVAKSERSTLSIMFIDDLLVFGIDAESEIEFLFGSIGISEV